MRDTVTGAVTIASRADGPDGAQLSGRLHELRITPDGRYVVFTLSPGGRFTLAPQFDSVWRRDLRDGRTELVSRADGADGAPADSFADGPSISDDGSRVAFVTTARNLGDGDAIGDEDVHVRDLAAGRTLLASRSEGTAPALRRRQRRCLLRRDQRRRPQRRLLQLRARHRRGAHDGAQNVFVRRLDSGATAVASVADDGRASTYGGPLLAIDRDGERIAFRSEDPRLPARRDAIYVRDLAAARLLLVSRGDGADGAPADGRIGQARLSADGDRVAFEASSSGPLAPGAPTDEGRRVYLRELAAARTSLLSRASGAGRRVPAFAQLGGISGRRRLRRLLRRAARAPRRHERRLHAAVRAARRRSLRAPRRAGTATATTARPRGTTGRRRGRWRRGCRQTDLPATAPPRA